MSDYLWDENGPKPSRGPIGRKFVEYSTVEALNEVGAQVEDILTVILIAMQLEIDDLQLRVAALEAVVDLNVPVITSSSSASVPKMAPFAIQLTADNGVDVWVGSDLPLGVTLDPATGLLAGEVQLPSVQVFLIAAGNDAGTASQVYTLTVLA